MTPGSHHMIVYTSQDELRPEGTIDDASCGMGASFPFPSWLYSAQTSEAAIQLPGDDGAGKPLGMEVLANQPAFVQMHYLNATDAPIDAHVTLRAYALDAGREFTKTAAYVTYYGNIDIPAQAVNHVEPANLRDTTCSVPAGSKFWLMSTHAHKQAVKTRVLDGTTSVFESTDWEHPEPALWTGTAESPFYSFASGKLSYECTYTNPTNRAISTGDSAATDEMCMASGYYFPATSPKFCYNNQAL